MTHSSNICRKFPLFPLYEKASAAGVITTGNCLIVAPTGTGKSYIGRAILEEAVLRGEPGVHAYLVPYRALAAEIYESLLRELDQRGATARVKISTGDHRDPFYPGETDILVSTFERFSALLPSQDLRLGRVVLDEVHLLADESRGPALESLLVRLKTWKRPTSICALSAVVSNPQELADWLGVPLILGSAQDRTVEVEFRCEVEKDIGERLKAEVARALEKGEQAIIFCNSKAASQKVASDLQALVAGFLTEDDIRALSDTAAHAAGGEEEAEDLLELLSAGVAYHHAGLSRDARLCVEAAFRNRHLKVISCTPTLAAGVNLPARLVVVRDVYRMEFIRGRPRRVVLSTGELLNMLGRAGRPGQVEAGLGVALVEPDLLDEDELSQLELAIREAKGNPVRSRLPDSFDSFMRFLLAVISDRGEATLVDTVEAVRESLWYHLEPQAISFDRPLQVDIMEDIPSFSKVDGSIRLERAWPVSDGVAGSVVSGDKIYNFSITIAGEECSCPAKSKWRRRETCKHLACAIYTLLFDDTGIVDEETRNRALYASAHRFRKTLDLGTKIKVAMDILAAWGLIERVPGGFRATGVGAIAANSGLDLLLSRIARDRVLNYAGTPSPSDVASWVTEDFFGDETKREKWLRAVNDWVGETPLKKIKLPERYRGDFERGLEQLAELTTVYGGIAKTLGNTGFAEACELARGCLAYGVAPELIPLAALRIPQLGRARCRFLHDERGIKSLEDLANADPQEISGPGIPPAMVASWVDAARAMLSSKKRIDTARTQEDKKDEIDEFLATFQADRLIFEVSA